MNRPIYEFTDGAMNARHSASEARGGLHYGAGLSAIAFGDRDIVQTVAASNK
jgi:hypothetical protein